MARRSSKTACGRSLCAQERVGQGSFTVVEYGFNLFANIESVDEFADGPGIHAVVHFVTKAHPALNFRDFVVMQPHFVGANALFIDE